MVRRTVLFAAAILIAVGSTALYTPAASRAVNALHDGEQGAVKLEPASGQAQEASSSGPPAAASQSTPQNNGVSIKVDVNTVLLNVSVSDRYTNRSITGLQKDDFQVYEDNTPQQVQQLSPGEAPFSLLILLDVSGSTSSYIKLMKEAATNFTRQVDEKDRIAVASFNSNVWLLQGFTSDRDAAARAIDRIHSGGGTAFYDALMTCINGYMRDIEGRKAIVVFTDGVDNQLFGNRNEGSQTTFDELYRRIQEVDTLIYTIFLDSEGQMSAMQRPSSPLPRTRRAGGWPLPIPLPLPLPTPGPTPTPRSSREDEKAAYETARDQLETIAEQTGGRMYSPHKATDLSGAYSEVADDLRVQYLLTYASTNQAQDNQWRSISVEIKNHAEAVVRTRKGYYAAGQSGSSDR
jgi:Ca-activated chloride channel family protein